MGAGRGRWLCALWGGIALGTGTIAYAFFSPASVGCSTNLVVLTHGTVTARGCAAYSVVAHLGVGLIVLGAVLLLGSFALSVRVRRQAAAPPAAGSPTDRPQATVAPPVTTPQATVAPTVTAPHRSDRPPVTGQGSEARPAVPVAAPGADEPPVPTVEPVLDVPPGEGPVSHGGAAAPADPTDLTPPGGPVAPPSPEAPVPTPPRPVPAAPDPVAPGVAGRAPVRTRPIAPGEDVGDHDGDLDDYDEEPALLEAAVRLPPGWYGNPNNPDKPVQWWDGTRLTDRPY